MSPVLAAEISRWPDRTAPAQVPLAIPKNAATACQYSEINVLIHWAAVIQYGKPAHHPVS